MSMQDPVRLLGQAATFLDALDKLSQAAPLERPVLVIGERGTGKELAAERLHRLSKRWEGPLVQLNCAALPDTLIDAELFGYEPGAFTGAIKARAGRFEDADGGTLFLDEIGTLSAQAQEKLLRVIEYGQLQRLGSNRQIEVDVRVIGATNADLPAMVNGGKFRADLLDRLSFEVITLPPLRHRLADIPLLADHFGRRMAAELEWSGFPDFTKEAMQLMSKHSWPGNVRELKNTVERSVYRWANADEPVARIIFDPFESPYRPQPGKAHALAMPQETLDNESSKVASTDYQATIAALEKHMLQDAMQNAKHNQRQAAEALGLKYDQLRHALKKHGLL